jgi:hypothetical protein
MIDPLAPIAGPYRPPRCKVGGALFCELRGTVVVYGLSDTPVPWPFTRGRGRGRPSPILCGDLVRSVRVETAVVVCALFGVTAQTVSKWRTCLAVPHANTGTHEREAAPKRGVPRPPHVLAALDAARRRKRTVGRPDPGVERAARVAAQRQREDLVRRLRDAGLSRLAIADGSG